MVGQPYEKGLVRPFWVKQPSLFPLDRLCLALGLVAARVDPEDLDGVGALGVGGDEDE